MLGRKALPIFNANHSTVDGLVETHHKMNMLDMPATELTFQLSMNCLKTCASMNILDMSVAELTFRLSMA